MLHSLQLIAERLPRQIAIEEPAGCISYRALWETVQKASEAIAALNPRVVAIDVPNSSAWIIVHLACVQAGIPQLPLPPFFTPQQRAHALRDAGADLLLDHNFDPSGVALRLGRHSVTAHRLENPAIALPTDTALITYTSGSTGNPKGVCLGQRGMEQVATSLITVLGTELAARHLCVLPLGVLLEQVGGLYTTILAGGTYIISEIPTYGDRLADALQESRATSCILVPEMLKGLVHACERDSMQLKDLRFAAVGGAKVPEPMLAKAEQLGLPIYQGYGLSELASVVAVNAPNRNRRGSVGEVLPHINYSIAADGEVILHQPAILGYTGGTAWQGPYPTGDLGEIDRNGFLSIRGRKKNLLITGYGRNVSPEWPESLLGAQPEIAQAFVYGDGEASLSALLVPSAEGADIGSAVARVNAQLPDYARIGAWQRRSPFTIASGELTGTGRVRRSVILQTLQKEKTDGFLRPACA